MTKFVEHKKCFCKRLDGKWTWDAPVWLTKAGMFANCVIKSPEGTTFDTQDEAHKNLLEVLGKLGIIKHNNERTRKSNKCVAKKLR
jgi:hypothetical protein